MSAVDERNLEHVRAIAQERGVAVLSGTDINGWEIREEVAPQLYEEVVLDFLTTIRRYNLCLETTESAEAFAAKVREYLLTGPDAALFAAAGRRQ